MVMADPTAVDSEHQDKLSAATNAAPTTATTSSSASPMLRDRRTTTTFTGNDDSGGQRWTAAAGGYAAGAAGAAGGGANNFTFSHRGQQPVATNGFDASRYSRAGGGGGGGGTTGAPKSRPPMRRSQSSMLHSLGTPSRYAAATGTRRTSFQMDGGGGGAQLTQTYPIRQQQQQMARQRQESNTSMFSRGPATATTKTGTQRFISMPDADAMNHGDDDVFAGGSSWSPSVSTLHIYAKQLQHPRSGIPCKEQAVKGVNAMVFSGSDASEWFMLSADGVYTADQAQILGQKLVELGLISSVDEGSPEFKVSSSAWFYFCHASNFTKTDSELADGEQAQQQHQQNGDKDKTKPEPSKACIIL